MNSLRRTIIVAFTLTLGCVCIAATVVAYEFGLSEAGEFMDDHLRQVATMTNGQPGLSSDASALAEPEDHFAMIIWGRDGRIEFSTSDSPKGVDRPAALGLTSFEAQGVAWRAYSAQVGGRTTMIAQLMSARDEIAQHSALSVAIPILAIIPIAWLIVFVAIGRVLRRLTSLSESIAERGVGIEDPLPVENLPREIRPLVAAMNTLIERLQAALCQQRRFVADSAHELRTPLAALRIQIDNLAALPEADAPEAASVLQTGIKRASTVLDQLLKLARFDGQESRGSAELVDLGGLLTQAVADSVEIAEAARISIGVIEAPRTMVMGVPADIQLLVTNLIDNAIRYTPAGGEVDCGVRHGADGAVVEIIDTGPGVADADLPRLTDRFFRAAAQDKFGSGLGLSIVKAIADFHGLTVTIRNREARSGLQVEILFPALVVQPHATGPRPAAANPRPPGPARR